MELVIEPIPALAARALASSVPVRVLKAQVDVNVGDVVFFWCPNASRAATSQRHAGRHAVQFGVVLAATLKLFA